MHVDAFAIHTGIPITIGLPVAPEILVQVVEWQSDLNCAPTHCTQNFLQGIQFSISLCNSAGCNDADLMQKLVDAKRQPC